MLIAASKKQYFEGSAAEKIVMIATAVLSLNETIPAMWIVTFLMHFVVELFVYKNLQYHVKNWLDFLVSQTVIFPL